MYSVTICYVEPSLPKSDGPISETGGSEISKISDKASKMMTADLDDWRTPWYVI
jgi:hypothetical protein